MEEVPSARVDAERNRLVLLEAAAGALSKDPDASLSEVARTAGLTRATLYRHFGSREGLLGALRDDALASAKEAIAAAHIEEGTALEALRRVIDAIASLGGRFWPLLMEGADRDPGFLDRRALAFAPVLVIVERGQAAGEIRLDVSAQWVVTAVTALLAAAVRQDKGSGGVGVAEMVFGMVAFGIQRHPLNLKT